MDQINLAEVVQTLANIGVLAGIIFLAYELRQNTRATKLTATEHYLSNTFALDLRIAENAEVAELLIKASQNGPLTDVERLRLRRFCYAGLRHWENIHYLHYTSVLDEKFWAPVRHEIIEIVRSSPFMADYWKDNQSSFTDEFNTEMKAISQEASDRHRDV